MKALMAGLFGIALVLTAGWCFSCWIDAEVVLQRQRLIHEQQMAILEIESNRLHRLMR